MAVWLPAQNKFYLPPQPITKILSSDDYVSRTNIFYHATSDRLLIVGHPLYEVTRANDNTMTVPKVSPNQYRVFRVRFPDPNRFAFGDKDIFDPETERLVWGLRGIEIGRGQPLGVGISGNPLLNRFDDAENPSRYNNTHATGDNRQNVAFDAKQTQMFLIGCTPATGEHWSIARRCAGTQFQLGDCPPIELVNTVIEDGDMFDIGLGAMDFGSLQANKADAPLDIAGTVCKYPDYIKMGQEVHGNSLFFFARREQMYLRHVFTHAGIVSEKEKVPTSAYIAAKAEQPQNTIATDNYFVAPSGSLVSSDVQIFNRPYWLQRSQGQNNGICWRNELFVTVADNTRGTTMNINVLNKATPETYDSADYNEYTRHVEEYELSFIVQLCKVKLTPENLAFLHNMDPTIIDSWQLTVSQPPANAIEDKYRFIESLATKCPDNVPPPTPTDPYKDLRFWDVDLSERMSEQLDQFPLGRKFLYQSGLAQRSVPKTVNFRKRRSSNTTVAKRRRRA